MKIYFSKSAGGFYDMAVADYDLPDDAVEITPEERSALLAGTIADKEIGLDANGRPVLIERVIDISDLRSRLQKAVDQDAETERLKYITGGAGQAMTYSQKADEARSYLASTDPDPADYPLLLAEVGITASDLGGVATIVNAAFRQWQVIGAAIEAVRLGTKAAIDAAITAEDAQAAYEAAVWPTPQT